MTRTDYLSAYFGLVDCILDKVGIGGIGDLDEIWNEAPLIWLYQKIEWAQEALNDDFSYHSIALNYAKINKGRSLTKEKVNA